MQSFQSLYISFSPFMRQSFHACQPDSIKPLLECMRVFPVSTSRRLNNNIRSDMVPESGKLHVS